MTSLVVSEAKVRRPARTLQQLLNAREKVFRSQWAFLLFRKMIPSPACRRSRGRRGDGILIIRQHKRGLSVMARIGPRSGRTKIAQRFIAGYGLILRTLVRQADDRILVRHSSPTSLSPVSRALGKKSYLNPSTKCAGLFSFVRCADSTQLLFILLIAFTVGLGSSCSRQH